MNHLIETGSGAGPWNKGKLVGQKAPLRLKDMWAIRIRLQLGSRTREWRCLAWPSIVNCDRAIL
jgi:hypothetical protein